MFTIQVMATIQWYSEAESSGKGTSSAEIVCRLSGIMMNWEKVF